MHAYQLYKSSCTGGTNPPDLLEDIDQLLLFIDVIKASQVSTLNNLIDLIGQPVPHEGKTFGLLQRGEKHTVNISASYSRILEAWNRHFPNHRTHISCMETRIQRDNRIPRELPSPSVRCGFSDPPCTITHARMHGCTVNRSIVCLVGWSKADTACHINN